MRDDLRKTISIADHFHRQRTREDVVFAFMRILNETIWLQNSRVTARNKEVNMLYYAVVFLIVAIIAGALGFGGIAGASAGIAQILFFIFLALLVLSLIAGFIRKA